MIASPWRSCRIVFTNWGRLAGASAGLNGADDARSAGAAAFAAKLPYYWPRHVAWARLVVTPGCNRSVEPHRLPNFAP
jgi:hypothetical protein